MHSGGAAVCGMTVVRDAGVRVHTCSASIEVTIITTKSAGTLTAHVCEPLPPPTRLRFGASRSLLLATHGLVPPGAPE